MLKVTKILIILATLSGYAAGQKLDSLPKYEPQQIVSGTLRLWGHGSPTNDFMGKSMTAWQAGFQKFQPNIKFENRMYGTASAIGGLYTGQADIAILGREILKTELVDFERVIGHQPSNVDIVSGSLDVRNKDFALVIFVHKDNPLSHLTMAQLDAIFGCEGRRGLKNIRTWGELGLTGEWANRSINTYGFALDRGFAIYIQETVLGGSSKWNKGFREFGDVRTNGVLNDAGQRVTDAASLDKYGIAISNLRYATPNIKAVAISPDGKTFYEANKENIINRKYPLARYLPAYFNRDPNTPIDPKVKEFLRYLLSREGQQVIVDDGGYLPLSMEYLVMQRKKLE